QGPAEWSRDGRKAGIRCSRGDGSRWTRRRTDGAAGTRDHPDTAHHDRCRDRCRGKPRRDRLRRGSPCRGRPRRICPSRGGRGSAADGPRTVRWTIAAGTHPSMMSDTARISDGLGAPAVGDVSPQAGGRPSVGAVAAQPARLVLDLADGSTPPSRWSPPAVPDDAAGYAALAVARVDEGDTTFQFVFTVTVTPDGVT